jgi:EAL domain-containing protein (putative c-di-GMP-specific phosphodiesterase class I)
MTDRIALVGIDANDDCALQDMFVSDIVIEQTPRKQTPRKQARPFHGVIRWAARSFKSTDRQSKRIGLTAHLREAIAEHRLSLDYQPQFDLRSGAGIGVEALARWIPRDTGIISPSIFIPLAEPSGLIAALGTAVLELACETVVQWRAPPELNHTLSVNVSAHQVDAAFCDALEHIVGRTGFDPRRLELEITESALFSHEPLALACLSRWKDLGVRVALDDFGTGYCSLSHLSKLPVDRIKLDKHFVRNMLTDRKNAAIVRTMIGLGRELGITVLAEGVEAEAQLDALLAMDCPQAQGYLMAPPLPVAEARLLLNTHWGRRSRTQFRRIRTLNEDCHAS